MDEKYEPMDIDLSVHSNSAMDISYNSSSVTESDTYLEADNFGLSPAESISTEPKLPIVFTSTKSLPSPYIKKFVIKMQKDKQSFNISLKTKIVCSAIILLLSFLIYQVLNIQCNDNLNPRELKTSLSSKLYGQSQAINSLIEALSVSERSKILFFFGGTGVGKTLTASLIVDHIGSSSNVYHFVMPSFMDRFTTEFMIGLSVCKHTTIIIDDLCGKDFDIKSHIQDVISKSQNLGKNITIFLIYHCDNAGSEFEKQCDKSFPNSLLQHFSQIDAFKKLIKFEPLKEEHLKQCIDAELGNRSLTYDEYRKLLNNFNVTLDGCKGVHNKIKMLGML